MHLGENCYSKVEPLTSIAAGKTNLVSDAGCKIEADKHNARRAEIGGCVSGIPISEENGFGCRSTSRQIVLKHLGLVSRP